ncbi:MAG TPA: hypothetical protein VF459_00665 [Caulobacteraceae bacterium]
MTQFNDPTRNPAGRFGAGNSGRPRGSRNRAAGRVAQLILEDFEANQGEFLSRLRKSYPREYVGVVTSLIPRQIETAEPDFDSYSADEIAQVAAQARAALERLENGSGTLMDLHGAVVCEPAQPAPMLAIADRKIR